MFSRKPLISSGRAFRLTAEAGPAPAEGLGAIPVEVPVDVARAKATLRGGLLSVTVNPEACKGCNLCVDVCPDGALRSVKQDEPTVARMREQWRFWQKLPDTSDRYINVSDLEQGIGVLPSLLVRRACLPRSSRA